MQNVKSFITATSESEIKNQVDDLLTSWGLSVVENENKAEEFFKDSQIEGYLYSETEQQFEINGEEESNYIPVYKVVITAYYKDAGSDDYCYSVEVSEL